MPAFLIYLSIILSNVTQSASTKTFNKKNYAPLVFNVLKATSAFLITLAFTLPGFSFHAPTLSFGLGYGALLALSMYAGYEALCRGPMALTSMLVSFSVVIPFIWGVTVRNEPMGLFKILAVIFLVAAIICTNADKIFKKQEKSQGFGVWLLFVLLTFAANGVSSILQKEHQSLFPGQYNLEFTLFGLMVCAAVYGLLYLISLPSRKKEPASSADTAPSSARIGILNAKGKLFGFLSGATTALSGLLTLWLASFEDASILFSIISAGGILASLTCGKFVFKEKLKLNHYLALVLGITSIVLMKL